MAAKTIFARASGAGKCGVAVYRLSGPEAYKIAHQLTGASLEPHRAARITVRSPSTGGVVDDGVGLYFPGPASFTGEDVVELQLHGSMAVERALYEALGQLEARAAEPGEFTRRALANGKLDLAQVEGLADLLEAETEAQRKLAIRQLGGGLSSIADGWRRRIVSIMTRLEAAIDFPDEEGVPADVAKTVSSEIDALKTSLGEYLGKSRVAQQIRTGLRIALVGPPNAGKSSLLNALVSEERAIVSDKPGTTRDVVEVRLDLNGVLATIVDTAGLRDQTTDEIEQEGMRRTRAELERADIVLWIVDGTAEHVGVGMALGEGVNVSRETKFAAILNKLDLPGYAPPTAPAGWSRFEISATTGHGVDMVVDWLSRAVEDGGRLDVGLTRQRHHDAVASAVEALDRAAARVAAQPELFAEDMRLAARRLGEITGAVGVEDILDEIFASFCIGK